jgi:hypothetical protein
MNRNSQTRSVKATACAAPAALPTFEQMVALSIARLRHDLTNLERISEQDPNWNEDDFETTQAMSLLAAEAQRLGSVTFASANDFANAWFRLSAVLDLAVKAFIQRDNWYFRSLEFVADFVSNTPEMLDFLERQAREFAELA